MAISSPISTDKINKSVNLFGSSLEKLKDTLTRTTNIIDKKNKNKRRFISKDESIFGRIREGLRRREKIEQQKASKPANIISNPAQALKNTAKGFLGRLMDFTGSLLLGWTINNLPTFIFMAKEFMDRVGTIVSVGKAFIGDLGLGLKAFGNLIGAIGTNIIKFDFFDSEGRVESAINDLSTIFDDMGSQVEKGIKAVTTSLGVDLDTGEEAPEFGTQYPADGGLQGEPSTTTGSFSGTGVSKGAQIAKKLQGDLGITDYQAAAIVGNLLEENTTLGPDVLENLSGGGLKRGLLTEAMRNGIGYGWAQWTYISRQKELYNYAKSRGINPDTQPLTDEINYGFLVKELRQGYLNQLKQTKNIEEASNFILIKYENPENKGTTEQQQRINASKRVLQLLPNIQLETPQPSNLPPAPISLPSASSYYKGLNVKSQIASKGVEYAIVGDKLGAGRGHNGVDIALPHGTYIALRVDCEIIDYGNTNPDGYGNEMHVWVPQYQIRLKFAHLSGAIITRGKVPAGKSFARIGSTGRSSAPHMHLEAGPRNKYKGDRDPSPYIPLLWLTDRPSAAWSRTATTSLQTQQRNVAQISQRPQSQQVSQISQQPPTRSSSSIVLIQQPQQIAQASPRGGGIVPIPIMVNSNSTNKFTSQRILLELNYT